MELAITREDMGIRLIEERTRLGYSQANFAHQTDISREALRLNELGRSGISAEFLGRAAQLGVDVQYVITGVRAQLDNTSTPTQQNVEGSNNNVIYGEKGIINSGTINNITTEKYTTKTKAVFAHFVFCIVFKSKNAESLDFLSFSAFFCAKFFYLYLCKKNQYPTNPIIYPSTRFFPNQSQSS
nr:helix-turn-helix transcriptional regulator [[Haemophilus] ducreyi]